MYRSMPSICHGSTSPKFAQIPTINFYFLFLAMVPLIGLPYSLAINHLKWHEMTCKVVNAEFTSQLYSPTYILC